MDCRRVKTHSCGQVLSKSRVMTHWNAKTHTTGQIFSKYQALHHQWVGGLLPLARCIQIKPYSIRVLELQDTRCPVEIISSPTVHACSPPCPPSHPPLPPAASTLPSTLPPPHLHPLGPHHYQHCYLASYGIFLAYHHRHLSACLL